MPKSKSKSKAIVRAASGRLPQHSDDVLRFYSNKLDAFRFPDMDTASTAVMRMPVDIAVVAGADSNAVVGISPPLSSAYLTNSTTTGNLAAGWSVTAHPLTSTLTSVSARSRMTGHRITVRYTGPEQTAGGTMFVGTALAFSTSMISSPLANYTAQMQAYPIRAGGQWVFYVPMYDNPGYKPVDGNWMNDSFMGMVFAFTGLPASQAYITIRSERSIEYVPELTATTLVSCAPEPYDPVALTEAGILSGTGPDESPTQQVSYSSRVGRAAWNMLKGTAAGVVAGARDDMRAILIENQLPIMHM